MQIIESENNVMIDIDQTLVEWTEPLVPGSNKFRIPYADGYVYLTPHAYHVALVKMYNERGFTTVVWSANGYRHALNVINALKLEKYVDFVMTKPNKYMDDSTADSALGSRVFCQDFFNGNSPLPR